MFPSQGQRLEFHRHQHVCVCVCALGVSNSFTRWACVCGLCLRVCVCLFCVKVIMTADSEVWLSGFLLPPPGAARPAHRADWDQVHRAYGGQWPWTGRCEAWQLQYVILICVTAAWRRQLCEHRKMMKGSFLSSSLSLSSSVARPLWRRTLPKLWWTWPMRWEHIAILWKRIFCCYSFISFFF